MPPSQTAERFSTIFREEHRQVRDGLLELIDAAGRRDRTKAGQILEEVGRLTGPHFRYEEERLYPALEIFYGADYIEQLLHAHDGAIAAARRIGELVEAEPFADAEAAEVTRLARGVLPHVSDCDGLSIMVERLPDTTVAEVLTARSRCNEQAVDLLRWAEELRERGHHVAAPAEKGEGAGDQ